MNLDQAMELTQDDFVVDLENGRVYHFGYVSGAPPRLSCVCYKPGEQNMQDAVALAPHRIMQLNVTKHDLRSLANR